MSNQGQGQDCRHEFPVDASCEHCLVSLSSYVRHLTQRARNLEREARAAWEQTRKMEAVTDEYRQATIEALNDCLEDPEPLVSIVQWLRALERTHKEFASIGAYRCSGAPYHVADCGGTCGEE